jgi:hypothetical protein
MSGEREKEKKGGFASAEPEPRGFCSTVTFTAGQDTTRKITSRRYIGIHPGFRARI